MEFTNLILRRFTSPSVRTLAVGFVLIVHAVLLGWIAVVNAPVADEIAHLPSGLSHWQLGTFDLYRVNPPLMRMIASLPLLIANPRTDWAVNDGPYMRPEFEVGRNFMRINGYDSFWLFTICRWAQIPVSMFGGWICYRWASELGCFQSGIVALILWCFCPHILTWGAVITPDLGATTFGMAAGYVFWHWLKTPSWPVAIVAGIALGFAELSKSTWIILFGLWPLMWLAWRYLTRFANVPKPPSTQLIASLIFALFILNWGYGFENSFQPLGRFDFISRTLGGVDAHTTPGNRIRETWLEPIPAPVPANYLQGIDVQKYDFERRRMSYLRGEHRAYGWYYYYLYGLAVKTPLGTLFLIAMALLLVFRRAQDRREFLDELVLLTPAIAILALASSQTGFNRHVRYVLPVVPYLYIFASQACQSKLAGNHVVQRIGLFSVATAVIGSLSVYPHSMSYFNAAAGGPRGGPFHLLHSNIDWGQDLLELERFIQHHPEVSPINLSYFGMADPHLARFSFETIAPPKSEGEPRQFKVGWYAISVNQLYGYQHGDIENSELKQFKKLTPDAMAGYSIYIFHLSADKLKLLK